MKIIQLTEENIEDKHICCAISDKKCVEGYESKKILIKLFPPEDKTMEYKLIDKEAFPILHEDSFLCSESKTAC